MQFQNAVITPQGRAMLGAANTDKPIKWTRFLFSSSPTRLTGQETELPEPTWGDGSVDAVVSQTELEQFVIYASATNNTDSGYACSYGIWAEQDGVEQLVAVANCLGDPTHVTGSSEGYTRFHLALTIKYGVNASVISVEPNIAGLISRGEFESWINRVVTTTSPSGAPYGESQDIYGQKRFKDRLLIGSMSDHVNALHFGDYAIGGSITPIRDTQTLCSLGSVANKWQHVYVEELHADYVSSKVNMILNADKIAHCLPATGYNIQFKPEDIIRANSHFLGTGTPDPRDSVWCEIGFDVVFDSTGRIPAFGGVRTLKFYFDQDTPYIRENMTRITVRVVGQSPIQKFCHTHTLETYMSLCEKTVISDGMVSVKIQKTGDIETGSIACDPTYPSPLYVIIDMELIR